ncbi:MAG: helix-turn-helix domain-containing protein [Alistipes sp.]|nr:helix-turn-helix domain-containing protein [Alistipes sp.]
METVVITSVEQLQTVIKELFDSYSPRFTPSPKEPSETMSLPMVLDYLTRRGYPTSKSKIYQLTSRGEMPHRKYGNKLVFIRTEIDGWMESQTTRKRDSKAETLRTLAQSARRKLNSPPRKK